MGTVASKPNQNSSVHIKVDSDNVDPRSPTPEITRTPLQGNNSARHGITKNADLRKNFETKGDNALIQNNPILTAVIKNHLQSYDPRSPTQDFDRTPIIITSKQKGDKNHNEFGTPLQLSPDIPCDVSNTTICSPSDDKNQYYDLISPKNLYNEFFDITLDETCKDEEPLGSSTASNDAIDQILSPENKNQSLKMLETNFDVVENEKSLDGEDLRDEDNNTTNNIKGLAHLKILDEDPRSPSVGIERTPIVVAQMEDSVKISVENMSDDSLIKALTNTNVELRKTAKKPHHGNSDGLLIYEDEANSIIVTPQKAKSEGYPGSRTPLSCMKNKTVATRELSKSTTTLNSSKTTGNINSTSRIPRLKSLSKASNSGRSISLKSIHKSVLVNKLDCENTPPHSHRDKWDKDSSVVL